MSVGFHAQTRDCDAKTHDAPQLEEIFERAEHPRNCLETICDCGSGNAVLILVNIQALTATSSGF
jgi:hypothetical protein